MKKLRNISGCSRPQDVMLVCYLFPFFLQNGQEDLNSMATDTFHTISEGQEKLVKSQEMIGNSQSRLRLTVESNMRDLTREKALIAAGHQELAAMTSNIRKQLGMSSQKKFTIRLYNLSKIMKRIIISCSLGNETRSPELHLHLVKPLVKIKYGWNLFQFKGVPKITYCNFQVGSYCRPLT